MENGFELIYEAIAVILFCIGLMLIFSIFQSLDRIEREVKNNIYNQHILYCSGVE